MTSSGIHHVSINVHDTVTARDFYVGVCLQALLTDPSGNLVELNQSI